MENKTISDFKQGSQYTKTLYKIYDNDNITFEVEKYFKSTLDLEEAEQKKLNSIKEY